MSAPFLGVPVDAAYHLVSLFAGFLAPLPGGLAAAAAIVGFTLAVRLALLPLSYRAMRGMAAQARVAPQAQALRKRHAGQPANMLVPSARYSAVSSRCSRSGCPAWRFRRAWAWGATRACAAIPRMAR